jgi:hypothetical protein
MDVPEELSASTSSSTLHMKGRVPPSDKTEEHDHTQQHVRRSNAINPKTNAKYQSVQEIQGLIVA